MVNKKNLAILCLLLISSACQAGGKDVLSRVASVPNLADLSDQCCIGLKDSQDHFYMPLSFVGDIQRSSNACLDIKTFNAGCDMYYMTISNSKLFEFLQFLSEEYKASKIQKFYPDVHDGHDNGLQIFLGIQSTLIDFVGEKRDYSYQEGVLLLGFLQPLIASCSTSMETVLFFEDRSVFYGNFNLKKYFDVLKPQSDYFLRSTL